MERAFRYLGVGTGEWIRSHLSQPPYMDYPYGMWRKFREFKLKAGNYNTFRRYVWFLKKLGLIRVVKKEVVGGRTRHYYGLVVERVDDPRWLYPQIALYPTTGFGGRRGKRYKEWVEAGKPKEELEAVKIRYKI